MPKKVRRPKSSPWRDVRDSVTGAVRAELKGEMDRTQFFGSLISVIICGLIGILISRIPTKDMKLPEISVEIIFSLIIGGVIFIIWLVSFIYWCNEVRRAFQFRSYEFYRDKIVRKTRFFGITRMKTYPVAPECFEIRPIRSWFDQFYSDWDTRFELVFLDVTGEIQCRIRKVSQQEARWLASLW